MEPIQLLGLIVVMVLLILLAGVHTSMNRGKRIERKLDALMRFVGMHDEVQRIDDEGKRRSTLAALDADIPPLRKE